VVGGGRKRAIEVCAFVRISLCFAHCSYAPRPVARPSAPLAALRTVLIHFARLPHQEMTSALQHGLRLRNHARLTLVTSSARSSAAAIFLLHLLAVLSISWSVVASRSIKPSRSFSARLTACWTCVVRRFALVVSLSHAPAIRWLAIATQHGARLRRRKPAHASCILGLRQRQHLQSVLGNHELVRKIGMSFKFFPQNHELILLIRS